MSSSCIKLFVVRRKSDGLYYTDQSWNRDDPKNWTKNKADARMYKTSGAAKHSRAWIGSKWVLNEACGYCIRNVQHDTVRITYPHYKSERITDEKEFVQEAVKVVLKIMND